MQNTKPLVVNLIGYGNLGFHLTEKFKDNKSIILNGIWLRSQAKKEIAGVQTFPIDHPLLPADITILAVSDKAIEELSMRLNFTSSLVVHCSGAAPITCLKQKRRGVWYPPISFSKEGKVDFSSITFCIETDSESDYDILEQLSDAIQSKWLRMHSNDRLKLHTAAVFANNFTNHLLTLSKSFCEENHINFTLLHPLILQGFNKALAIGPEYSQTGPAIRGDQHTMEKHLNHLDEDQKSIYIKMSHLIKSYYEKKL